MLESMEAEVGWGIQGGLNLAAGGNVSTTCWEFVADATGPFATFGAANNATPGGCRGISISPPLRSCCGEEEDEEEMIICYKCQDGSPVAYQFPGPDCPEQGGWTLDEEPCKEKCDPESLEEFLSSPESPSVGLSIGAFCAKCESGSYSMEEYPECECCVKEESGGYNCRPGFGGDPNVSKCVPCGPNGPCEFESLGACQNSGCETITNNSSLLEPKKRKPKKLKEEFSRMKTLWNYKF